MKNLDCKRCGTSGKNLVEVKRSPSTGGSKGCLIKWRYIDCTDCKGVGHFDKPEDIQSFLLKYHMNERMDQLLWESLNGGTNVVYEDYQIREEQTV